MQAVMSSTPLAHREFPTTTIPLPSHVQRRGGSVLAQHQQSQFLKSLEQWEMAWQKFDIGERFARHRYQNVLWTVEHIVQNGHVVAMRLVDSSWHTTPGWSYADISRVLLHGDESPQALSWTDIHLDTNISPKGYVLDVNQDLVAMVFLSVSTDSYL